MKLGAVGILYCPSSQRSDVSQFILARSHGSWPKYHRSEKMYRIPKDLDLRPVVGEFTTQVRVGQFDLQFTFGTVNFAMQSPVNLYREGKRVAHWEEGRWPDSGFFDVMNSKVIRCETVTDRRLVLEFENGLEMHLEDSSDQYETMQITVAGNPSPWII